MSFTRSNTHPENSFFAYRVYMPLFLILTLILASPLAWPGSEGMDGQPTASTPTRDAPGLQAAPATQQATASMEKKKDLTGFFAIGAIINILFFGAFIYWARKESQKSKKRKAGIQQ